MIWTLIAFAITFFVLKKYAFGPIAEDDRGPARPDPAGDRRGRQRPGRGAGAARAAPRADRGGEERVGRHPGRRPQGRRRPARPGEGGGRGRAAPPPRGDAQADRRRDGPGARPDPRRGRRPHSAGDAAGRRQGARLGRSAPPDRRGDRRPRLLVAGARAGTRRAMAVAQRMYARALYEAARDKGTVADVRSQLAALAEALEASPELEAFLSNPQLDPAAKADVLGAGHRGMRPRSSGTSCGSSPRRAGRASSGAIAHEFDAIVDEAEGRIAVELTTAHELSDDEAADDRPADRDRLRPERRGNPFRRSDPDRRLDPPGRLAACRRQRARPARTAPPRAREGA